MANEPNPPADVADSKKSPTKKITLIFSGIFSVLILAYFIKILLFAGITIMPFEIPKELKDKGYNDTTVAQIFLDKIREVNSSANTVYKRKDFELYQKELDFNVPFLEEKVSVGKAKSLIQRIFNFNDNKVSGNIRMVGKDSIEITTRYRSDQPVITPGKINDLNLLLKKAVESHYKSFDPYLLASYYEATDQDFQSVDIIKYTINNPPSEDDKWAYNLWGVVLMKYEWFPEAIEKINKAIQLDNKFFLPYYNLGQIAGGQKKFPQAISYYKKSIGLNPSFGLSYEGLSSCYLSMHNIKKADSCMSIAQQRNPRSPSAFVIKAQIYLAKKDTANAKSALDDAITNATKNTTAANCYALLASLTEKDDKFGSENLYGQAYHKNPSDFLIASLYLRSMYLNKDSVYAKKFEPTKDSLYRAALIHIIFKSIIKQKLLH